MLYYLRRLAIPAVATVCTLALVFVMTTKGDHAPSVDATPVVAMATPLVTPTPAASIDLVTERHAIESQVAQFCSAFYSRSVSYTVVNARMQIEPYVTDSFMQSGAASATMTETDVTLLHEQASLRVEVISKPVGEFAPNLQSAIVSTRLRVSKYDRANALVVSYERPIQIILERDDLGGWRINSVVDTSS